ncbi:TonB-dependent siderophore receptor, partial [Klebsiella pneumoniae]|nr:TonB-dependent siderophore receptor [Klebsiella pneumoniae]
SKNDYLWTQPDDSKGNVANGKVWRRINSRITDTDIFTDQLSLRGKFNTGAIKHSFNVGAEYSDQESDKGSYTTTYPGYAGSTTGGFNSDCAINDAWCTSLTNPNSKDAWLGGR